MDDRDLLEQAERLIHEHVANISTGCIKATTPNETRKIAELLERARVSVHWD